MTRASCHWWRSGAGGFYTLKERRPGHQNSNKLRQLGLADGIGAYGSYRAAIFAPPVGAPVWQTGPVELAGVKSAYEAEVKAVQLALAGVVARLEKEPALPPLDRFYVVIHSDCQSLVSAFTRPAAQQGEVGIMQGAKELASCFGGLFPLWQPRRRIKQYLGH